MAEEKILLTRDCRPSTLPLNRSYFHGVCHEPLSGETIADVLQTAAKESPDHVIFRTYEFNESITLSGLKQRADEVSKALLASGLQRGDIVFLIGVTDIEYFVLYFAVTQIGMIFLYPQIDVPYEKETRIYCNFNPSAVFVGKALPHTLVPVLQEYVKSSKTFIPTVAVNTEIDPSFFTPYKDFLTGGSAISPDMYNAAFKAVSIDDVASLAVSSGSSSTEHKVACHTQHFIVNFSKFTYQRVSSVATPEVLGLLNPTIDDAGCVLHLVRTVYNRIVSVLGPSNMTPAPDAVEIFMSFIEKERITWYSGLPFELIHCMKSSKRSRYDLSSLRGGNLLGQVTTEDTKRELKKIFPDIATIFGASEAFAGLSTSMIWSTEEQRLTTVGYAFPHCEVKLVNDNGRVVDVGEQGELCIRGWTVFKHYFNNEQLTAQAKSYMKNGWYHYGDICTMDETGHVTYIGRKSDCVRFKHYSDTVYPSKILSVVERHEKVQIAKVIGIQSDERGDDICLCVEPKQGESLTEKELEDMLSTELLDNMIPDYYFIFDKFPRTGGRQKVASNRLREIVTAKLEIKKTGN